jgi:hypothetical protein
MLSLIILLPLSQTHSLKKPTCQSRPDRILKHLEGTILAYTFKNQISAKFLIRFFFDFREVFCILYLRIKPQTEALAVLLVGALTELPSWRQYRILSCASAILSAGAILLDENLSLDLTQKQRQNRMQSMILLSRKRGWQVMTVY